MDNEEIEATLSEYGAQISVLKAALIIALRALVRSGDWKAGEEIIAALHQTFDRKAHPTPGATVNLDNMEKQARRMHDIADDLTRRVAENGGFGRPHR